MSLIFKLNTIKKFSVIFSTVFLKNNYFVFLFLSLLLSCNGLDDDSDFMYSHQSSFLINEQGKLYQFVNQNDTLKFHKTKDNIYFGSLINNSILFLDTLHHKLITYQNPLNAPTEKILNKNYYWVHGWENYLAFANQEETLLENHHAKKMESLVLPKGAEYLFCNQNRLWIIQKRKVWVYHLNTGSLIEQFDLQRDFYFADYNRGFNLFVYTQDSSGVYQKYFDTNAISTTNETKVSFQKIQHTKVLLNLYETEYLKNVELNSQNKLNIPNFLEEVHSFDMDFQSSILFYTRNDSLFVFYCNTNKKQLLIPHFGRIKKGLHFYSQ